MLAHLEAYVAVAEEGSFSVAADVLRVAQPVLSRRIKTLEQHFGGELFDRSRRRISTTDLGVLLLPHARDVLSRVERLDQVARTALASTAHTLGVPPDCAPAALARVIRAAAEHDVTIGVHELSADEREAGLADGSLTFALLRVPPETAPHTVPLGMASPPTGSAGRPVHLESLRPRRGSGADAPTILALSEEGIGFAAQRLRRTVARAGLPERCVRDAGSTAAAVAEALAGRAVLLCAEPFARRHDLAWAPLADAALHRGYELAAAPRRNLPGWLEPLLAEAVGARPRPAAASGTAEDPDPPARLAARG